MSAAWFAKPDGQLVEGENALVTGHSSGNAALSQEYVLSSPDRQGIAVADTLTFNTAPISRRGRYVTLRTPRNEDLGFLYELATDPEVGPRWRFRGAIPREANFANRLWEGVLAQFVIEGARSGEAIGLVSAYGANLVSGTANAGVVLAPWRTGKGYGIEAFILFAEYLFGTYRLRKLYLESPEFNMGQFKAALGRYLHIEGCLKAHEYYAGQLFDSYILTVYPEDLQAFKVAHPRLAVTPIASKPSSTGLATRRAGWPQGHE